MLFRLVIWRVGGLCGRADEQSVLDANLKSVRLASARKLGPVDLTPHYVSRSAKRDFLCLCVPTMFIKDDAWAPTWLLYGKNLYFEKEVEYGPQNPFCAHASQEA